MTNRMVIAAVCMVVASLAITRASKSEVVPPRRSLATFPGAIAAWRMAAAPPIPDDILRVLGVNDYVNRTYVSSAGRAAGLYIGYYESQQEGDTIHSPLNCLPGAGWEPVKKDRVSIDVAPGRTVTVNQVLIQKGLDRRNVVYWYQSHDRVVASEYWGKAYLVLDALRLNRTDGAIVRVITSLDDTEDGTRAATDAQNFSRAIFPFLSSFLPS